MLKSTVKAIHRLMNWLGALASAMLIILVLIMGYNVLARYMFSASSLALEEFSWHLYAAVFLLGIPYALKSNAHVRVDLLFEKLQPKTQAKIDLLGSLVFLIPTCCVIIWAGWHFTAAAYQLGGQPDSIAAFFQQLVSTGIGEKSQDPGGLLNRWIIKGLIPLAFLFLLLSAVAFILEKWMVITDQNRSSTQNRDPS